MPCGPGVLSNTYPSVAENIWRVRSRVSSAIFLTSPLSERARVRKCRFEKRKASASARFRSARRWSHRSRTRASKQAATTIGSVMCGGQRRRKESIRPPPCQGHAPRHPPPHLLAKTVFLPLVTQAIDGSRDYPGEELGPIPPQSWRAHQFLAAEYTIAVVKGQFLFESVSF